MFPMAARDRAMLLGLVGFSVVAFLPIWGGGAFLGVATFGWLMAALLLGAPLVQLALLLRKKP